MNYKLLELTIDTAPGAKIELGSGSVLLPGVSAAAIEPK